MIKMLKKLFFPGETDKQVEAINAESKAILEDATRKVGSHNELLKRNGVTLRIYIAKGGDHGH